jgi:hypothetical protein
MGTSLNNKRTLIVESSVNAELFLYPRFRSQKKVALKNDPLISLVDLITKMPSHYFQLGQRFRMRHNALLEKTHKQQELL